MQAETDASATQPGAPGRGVPPPSARVALFLDIDGTLVHHADHPGAVAIDAALHAMLARLAQATDGALALISGRAIADIDALFAPSRFAVAGQHGTERRSADGSLHCHAPLTARLHGVAEQFRQLVHEHPGLLLEEKGASLALHYRNAPEAAGLVAREMQRVLAGLGDEFELQAGKFVCELKPGGKDKGTAIAEFMSEAPFAGRRPVFVGDDLTDELGFDLVNRTGGDTVKVGPGPTCARWRLANADAVRDWLSDFASAANGAAARGAAP